MPYAGVVAFHLLAVTVFAAGLLAAAAVAALQGRAIPDAARRADLGRLARWNSRVTTPALLLVWALGLYLAQAGGWFPAAWLHAKIACVLALSALHGVQSKWLRRAASDAIAPAVPRWRLPAIAALLVAIVTLATVKPG